MLDFRIVTIPVATLLTLAIYAWFLQPLNAYVGMVPVHVDMDWVVLFVAWTVLAATVLPRRIERPSHLFLLFYGVICVPWGSVLWGATGLLSMPSAALMLALLYLPAFVIRASARFAGAAAREFIVPVHLFRPAHLYVPLAGILLVGAVAAVANLGHGSFGIDNVYDRRLAGREALSDNVIAPYLIAMAINGAAPLLAFMAGSRRSPLLFLTAIAFVVLMFWLLGLKSPFIAVGVMCGLGFALGVPGLRRHLVPLGMLGLVAVLAAVAAQVSDGSYSAVADYVIRRVAMVQPEVQSYYMDHFLGLDLHQKLFGADLQGHSDWTFLIGETYLHNPATNADTNGFLHALLRGGLVGYAVSIAVVCGFLVVVDALFAHTRMPEFIAVAGLYGLLVSEQSYTAALLTSGVVLCLALTVLFSYPSREAGNHKLRMQARRATPPDA